VAYASAAFNLVAVPSGLSIAPVAVLTVAVIADFPLQIWLLIVSIAMVAMKRETSVENAGLRRLSQQTLPPGSSAEEGKDGRSMRC
jgi:type IV secretory pathway TrbD component